MRYQRLLRVTNGLRKVAAGLRPFSESVWPGVQNDLFVAHRSLYTFATQYCAGRRVLDAGCGTGYGSHDLIVGGAASVIGVDIDRQNVRYASRHFRAPNLRFMVGDLEALALPYPVDVIVALNSLEHLHEPERFFASARSILDDNGNGNGMVIVGVPPVRNEDERRAHDDIHYHRAVLTVDQWYDLLTAAGFRTQTFLHQTREPNTLVDLNARHTSGLNVSDFVFHEVELDALRTQPTITALFVATANGS